MIFSEWYVLMNNKYPNKLVHFVLRGYNITRWSTSFRLGSKQSYKTLEKYLKSDKCKVMECVYHPRCIDVFVTNETD